jgi:hypothetical protein
MVFFRPTDPQGFFMSCLFALHTHLEDIRSGKINRLVIAPDSIILESRTAAGRDSRYLVPPLAALHLAKHRFFQKNLTARLLSEAEAKDMLHAAASAPAKQPLTLIFRFQRTDSLMDALALLWESRCFTFESSTVTTDQIKAHLAKTISERIETKRREINLLSEQLRMLQLQSIPEIPLLPAETDFLSPEPSPSNAGKTPIPHSVEEHKKGWLRKMAGW